jgi:outer membrane protein insertion porin family
MRQETSATFTRKGKSRGMLRPTLIAILLSSTMVSGPFLTQAVAENFAFSSVSVKGNETVDTATILSYAGIAKGASVSPGELNDAYQRIFASGLFSSVDITPQGGTLVITVVELPLLNVVDFQGNKLIKDEKLVELVKSKSRLVYSPAQAEADAAQITEAYRVQSRLAATVTPRMIRRDNRRVDLVFEITEGKVVENEGISFVGNRAFSDRRLRQILETKQAGFLRQVIKADTFVPERLEVDKQMLRDFYLSRGYIDVQVIDAMGQLSRERDATFVTYTVQEGQSFKIGAVSTVSEVEGVDAAEFAAVQKMRSGVTYSPAIIDNNLARMENLVLRKGLTFVTIVPRLVRNDRNQTLDVEYVIKRGQKVFVERIDIEGNTTTLDQVVRRQFRTVEGDAFNPSEIRQAAERIRALGFFVDAKVDAKPGSNPDQVVVDVNVEEKPTGSISLGASYGTSAGVGLNLGFSETNFLGRGQGFSINVSTASSSREGSISFVEPSLLGRDLKLKLGANYTETSNGTSALYDTRAISLSGGLEFPIAEQSRMEVRYKIFQDTIKNVTSSAPLLQSDGVRGAELGSGIGYTYSFDNRVTGINPKSSLIFRFGQDFIGLGGDINYMKSTLLGVAETKVFNEDVTLRAIVEGGAVNTFGGYNSRVTDRYFGNGKMRGFETNGIGPRGTTGEQVDGDALGGNFYATAKFEAEFPLGLPEEYGITGGVFYDMGTVFGLDSTSLIDNAKLRSAVGLSLLWNTPIGPLRFNFSDAVKKETYDKEQKFDLTISTKF